MKKRRKGKYFEIKLDTFEKRNTYKKEISKFGEEQKFCFQQQEKLAIINFMLDEIK